MYATIARKLYSILITISALMLLAMPVMAAESSEFDIPDCFSTLWPHELSELQPDPSLTFGRLENGFRYVLKTNKEPQDRVGIFLNVQAGSINETESQRGLAHFLEHMLFNGTTNFKPGALIEYFQSIGMSFGGDTNAHTTYGETVYKIILPHGEEQDLDEGLLVMSDYARGALLVETEVDRERGVILAEKTARDSVSYRAHIAGTAFNMKGTMIPERIVIGTDSVLKTTGSSDLKEFYETWYRPENMILVMVGDFDKNTAEAFIAKHFETFVGVGEQALCPEYGRVEHSGTKAFYHFEPEQGYTDVSIEMIWNKERQNDSFALQVEGILRYMAAQIINTRLAKLAEKPDTLFNSAYYYAGTTFGRYGYAGIGAKNKADKWQNTLELLDTVVRRAIKYGFSQKELSRVKKEILNELENAVLTRETINSLVLANQIIRNLNSNRVSQSPSQELEMYESVISQVTTEQLHEIFRNDWSKDIRLIEVIGDAKLAENDAPKIIENVYANLSGNEIFVPEERAEVEFPYLKTPPQGIEPQKAERFDAIDVEKYTYENGVILNIKKTDFKKNSFSVSVQFGDGRKSGTLGGISLLAEAIINGSGTNTLKRTELEDVLAGSSVNYWFNIEEDSFSWNGSAVVNDGELLFQVLQAVILDPGMRQEMYDISMKNFNLMYQQLGNNVQGAIKTKIDPFLAGDDVNFGLPEWESFNKLTLENVRSWLKPYFREAELEISVVGDVDPQKIKNLVSRYFGTIPTRRSLNVSNNTLLEFPSGKTLDVTVDSSIDKAIVRVAWPTEDFWDIGRTRRLHVLAAVMDDRLRKIVREKLGASYSPFVYSAVSKSYPGYGVFAAQVVVESESINLVKEEVLKIAASLVSEPVSQDELERARGPIMTSIKDSVRSNNYWLSSVLSLSSRYPQQLTWPLDILEDFGKISVDDMTHLASTYLRKGRVAIGIVRPSNK